MKDLREHAASLQAAVNFLLDPGDEVAEEVRKEYGAAAHALLAELDMPPVDEMQPEPIATDLPDAEFASDTPGSGFVTVLAPLPGSTLNHRRARIRWDGPSDVSYAITAGTTSGASDLFNTGDIGSVHVHTLEDDQALPGDGAVVHLRMHWSEPGAPFDSRAKSVIDGRYTDWTVTDSSAQQADLVQRESDKSSDSAIVAPKLPQNVEIQLLRGYGTQSNFGNDGRVIEVKNLNDRGPGSWRDALLAKGARKIVFTVAGTPHLETPIIVTESRLSVLGSTAPDEGFRPQKGPDNGEAMVRIKAADVLFENIAGYGHPNPKGNRDNCDIFSISAGSHRVCFSQVSAGWSIDELIQVWCSNGRVGEEISEVTIEYCLLGEGLHDAGHSKGLHSKGILIGRLSDMMSVHHNYFVGCFQRCPRVTANHAQIGNNIVIACGPGARGLDFGTADGVMGADIEANRVYGELSNVSGCLLRPPVKRGKRASVYAHGNIGGNRRSMQDPERSFFSVYEKPYDGPLEEKRHCTPEILTHADAEGDALLEHVRKHVGCKPYNRSAIDQRWLAIQPGGESLVNVPPEGSLY